MVLSNKKLKQRLRAALTESLAAKEAGKEGNDAEKSAPDRKQLQSLNDLLESATRKPRLSKREIRRRKLALENPTPSQENIDSQQDNKEMGLIGSDDSNANKQKKKKKKKKRKRMDGPEEERGVGSNESIVNDSENEVEKEKDEIKKEEEKKKSNKKKKDKKEKKKGAEKKEGESKVEVAAVQSQDYGVPTKLYVGGIPYYSTEDDIRSFFESCGTISEVDCMKFPESGKFRGIAMITFKTEAAARRALALDGADMGGLFLKIQPYKATHAHKSSDFTPEFVDGYNRIYVGNLSWDVTEYDLKKLFSDCNISSIRFGINKTTGEFRGYAHVDFHDSISLMKALKLDQEVVCGRPARISCAVPKKESGTHLGSELSATKKAENGESFGGGKKKRRTCYECGVPGHISSSCPQKSVHVENSNGGS